jgi:secreted trypsin-like serine protease
MAAMRRQLRLQWGRGCKIGFDYFTGGGCSVVAGNLHSGCLWLPVSYMVVCPLSLFQALRNTGENSIEVMGMYKRTFAFGFAVLSLAMGCGAPDTASEKSSQTDQSIVRGTAETGRAYVVELQFERYSGGWTRCSGSYYAPRVVLTAAHCIPSDPIPGRVFAYWGSDLQTDLPLRNNIPAPGQPTVWAKADSWQVHPAYSKAQRDADMAVVYLDRKLPFDPLPLGRFRLDSSWTGKMATLVGWGALQALSADIQTNIGSGVKRTGKAPILGTPTLADYHADDPNPGMLSAAIRDHYVKLDGHSPNANGCAGDSGGPIIVNQWGQDYVVGVASWTGLWCEDYSLYTRIDPFLPFLDEAYRRGGQAPLIPYLDCVDPRPNGKLAAYFGYKNDNGVSISVPYDTSKNTLPLDVGNERPSLFLPGNKHFQFGIDFTPTQTVYWKLSPTNSPTTELRATSKSPRCADSNELKCARACEATMSSQCVADFGIDFRFCMDDCLTSYQTFVGCETQWSAYLQCVQPIAPAAANWYCDPSWDVEPRPIDCDPQFYATLDCYYGVGG